MLFFTTVETREEEATAMSGRESDEDDGDMTAIEPKVERNTRRVSESSFLLSIN